MTNHSVVAIVIRSRSDIIKVFHHRYLRLIDDIFIWWKSGSLLFINFRQSCETTIFTMLQKILSYFLLFSLSFSFSLLSYILLYFFHKIIDFTYSFCSTHQKFINEFIVITRSEFYARNKHLCRPFTRSVSGNYECIFIVTIIVVLLTMGENAHYNLILRYNCTVNNGRHHNAP